MVPMVLVEAHSLTELPQHVFQPAYQSQQPSTNPSLIASGRLLGKKLKPRELMYSWDQQFAGIDLLLEDVISKLSRKIPLSPV